MTTLYKQIVPQKDRAKVLTLEANQKYTVPPKDLGIDAVILPMGGMDKWDGSHMLNYSEPTFKGRFNDFNADEVPVIGRFNLNAGMWLKEQHTANEVENQLIRDNFVLRHLIDAWHDGNWSWDSILSKQGKWLPIKALEFRMVETEGLRAGSLAPDDWQARTFRHMVNHVKYLIDNGMAPKIPIILSTGPWFLSLYPVNLAQEITNRKDWLYLNLGQWTLSSTATFDNLDAIFAFRPAESFLFSTYPDKYYERILLHEYTGAAQKCKTITDAAGNPSTVSLALWQSTAEDMTAMLGAPVVVPPPVEPPPSTELTAQVAALELKVKLMDERLSAVEARIIKAVTVAVEAIQKLAS